MEGAIQEQLWRQAVRCGWPKQMIHRPWQSRQRGCAHFWTCWSHLSIVCLLPKPLQNRTSANQIGLVEGVAGIAKSRAALGRYFLRLVTNVRARFVLQYVFLRPGDHISGFDSDMVRLLPGQESACCEPTKDQKTWSRSRPLSLGK